MIFQLIFDEILKLLWLLAADPTLRVFVLTLRYALAACWVTVTVLVIPPPVIVMVALRVLVDVFGLTEIEIDLSNWPLKALS